MLALALTAWTLASPVDDDTEAAVTTDPVVTYETPSMSAEDELRFIRKNRLGGYGAFIGPIGVGVATMGVGLAIVGGFAQDATASNAGLAMFFGGGALAITGPVVQAVGVFGAARILSDHGIHAPRGWATAGLFSFLATPLAGIGYGFGVGLLAGQAEANRLTFIDAFGRPPGPRWVAQLRPMHVPGGGGLALAGRW